MFEQTVWKGKSGKEYKYGVYNLGEKFGPAPANYAFVNQIEPDWFMPVYIGQTSNMRDEVFENHPQWQCILKNRPTHICVHRSSNNEQERIAEVNDIVEKYVPPCNGPF